MTEQGLGPLDKETLKRIARPLGMIPQGLYIMASEHEDHVRAMLVSWVQQVSFDPPMISVAISKGREIVPILHDAHAFALSQLAPDDKVTRRRFAERALGDDELLGLEITRKTTGSPVLKRALTYFDCELMRHIDVDGDHDLYVGLIRDADVLREGEPPIHLREDGLKY